MLVEGKGAGDAVDSAGGNGIDDSLLVIVGASLETGILSSLQAVDDGLCCIVAQRREAIGVLLTVLCLVGILKLGVGTLCVVSAEVSVLQLIVGGVAFQTIPAVAAQERNGQADALSLRQDLATSS